MLYRHSEVFRAGLMCADMLLVSLAWVSSYGIRFHSVFEVTRGQPEFTAYLKLLIFIIPIWFWMFRQRKLYEPLRTGAILREIGEIIAASTVGVVLCMAVAFSMQMFNLSRLGFLIFYVLSLFLVIGMRVSIRLALRGLRRRGYNLRYLVVVGGGKLAEGVIDRIHDHPEAGLRVAGVFLEDPNGEQKSFCGVPVVGGYDEVGNYLQGTKHRIDQVVLALPQEHSVQYGSILSALSDELVTIRIVPDLLDVMTLRSSVEDLEGLPMINIREGRLEGLAAIQKRVFDFFVSGIGLILISPVLLLIALAVRLSSKGPILYSQERMGLDGHVFKMLKFRTMKVDAESETGPVWTSENDPRRTWIGTFLRKSSLDELPQFWNVFKGDMSLVGPRPERPVFIEEFRKEIPGYMLRHSVKAGVTGWAQIHGWRGDTSLHERIEHDIYYIQNWSLGLDIRIIFLTVIRGFFNSNAY